MPVILFLLAIALVVIPASQVDAQSSNAAEKSAPEIAEDSLDSLFARLRKERRPKIAENISKRIWARWRKSDSATIDLFGGWARKAISEDKFAVALDLLDQITTLRPDYAEGWNQRATLHFMMKNYGKSMEDVERVLALEPRHFGALSGLGMIFQAFDDKKKALAAWYRVLALYPAMENAQKAVIRLEEQIAAKRI